MTPIISILISSLKRPVALKQSLEAYEKLWSGKFSYEALVMVDTDDSDTLRLQNKLSENVHFMAQRKIRGWANNNRYLNMLAAMADGNFLWIMNDDSTVATQDWDRLIVESCDNPDRQPLLVLARSHGAEENIWPIVTRAFYEVMGQVFPTICSDWYLSKLAELGEIKREVPISVRHIPTQSWVPGRLDDAWKLFKSDRVCRMFERDRLKLEAVIGKRLPHWSPKYAP